MKRPVLTFAALLSALLLSSSAFAIPETVTYTGYLESSDLEPISDTLEMSFRVHTVEAEGEPIWSQPSQSVEIFRGRFSATLEDISTALDQGAVWLEVTVEDEVLSPRTRVDSVPYALQAQNAETVGGMTPEELQMGGGADLNPLQERIDALETRIAELEELTSDISVTSDPNGNRTLLIEGVNVQIANGEGATHNANGLGNLVLGYNERPAEGAEGPQPVRTGSHNIAIGQMNSYSGTGGIIAANESSIEGSHSVALASRTTAVGSFGAALSGLDNTVAATTAAIAGQFNDSTGSRSGAMVGGFQNALSADFAASIAGSSNSTEGLASATVGGNQSVASGQASACIAGEASQAMGPESAVVGGNGNLASGEGAVVIAGTDNTASGRTSSVGGGELNTASGINTVVSGGRNRSATNSSSWAAGSLLEAQ